MNFKKEKNYTLQLKKFYTCRATQPKNGLRNVET